MDTPRFYVSELREPTVVLPQAETRHAILSLRLSAGDEIELFDGRGGAARAVLVGNPEKSRGKAARTVSVQLGEIRREPPPSRTLTLISAGCKGARLDWLIEKTTELGVTRIVLAEFERSVVHIRADQAEKLQRTAIEACKQSGRNWLPEIVAGVRALDAAREPAELFVCDLGAAVSYRSNEKPETAQTAFIVGPEGGLMESELAAFRSAGAQFVRLAEHVLRVETAAVCAAAQWAGHLR